jgi:hypothetical protein
MSCISCVSDFIEAFRAEVTAAGKALEGAGNGGSPRIHAGELGFQAERLA